MSMVGNDGTSRATVYCLYGSNVDACIMAFGFFVTLGKYYFRFFFLADVMFFVFLADIVFLK